MPQFTVDGKTYEFEGRPMLLQFALDNDIEIPYFCYHPAMSAPTNCRMCLVEVGWTKKDRETGEVIRTEDGEPDVMWGRKPATACNTPIDPDMVVRTHKSSPAVKEMQKGVLEYMLVNHPLDCPICDQAGECPLQIWTYEYGPEGSRFENLKVHRPKRVELGPNVVLDAERCINCTRCVRFTEEISGSNQLSIVGRGEKNYPSTGPGQTFDDPYSMNTIDLCPVGALTSRQFRFKARVWEMAYGPGVCTSCSKGCNIDVWTRDNQVMRLTPRENAEVNNFWMCDSGRIHIDKYNEGRVSGARLKGDVPVEMEEALNKAAALIKAAEGHAIVFVGSPYASFESNYALRELANKTGHSHVYYLPNVMEGWGDSFLRRDDRTPNAAACEALGFKATTAAHLASEINKEGRVVYMLEDDRLLEALGDAIEAPNVIVHATHHSPALSHCDVVLPAAMEIEADATFLNADGKAQTTVPVKQVKQMDPEAWMRLPKSRLDKAGVAIDRWRHVENIYDVMPGWQMIAAVAKSLGHEMGMRHHKDVFAKLRAEFDAVREVEHSYKIPKEAFKITQLDFAVK